MLIFAVQLLSFLLSSTENFYSASITTTARQLFIRSTEMRRNSSKLLLPAECSLFNGWCEPMRLLDLCICAGQQNKERLTHPSLRRPFSLVAVCRPNVYFWDALRTTCIRAGSRTSFQSPERKQSSRKKCVMMASTQPQRNECLVSSILTETTSIHNSHTKIMTPCGRTLTRLALRVIHSLLSSFFLFLLSSLCVYLCLNLIHPSTTAAVVHGARNALNK